MEEETKDRRIEYLEAQALLNARVAFTGWALVLVLAAYIRLLTA